MNNELKFREKKVIECIFNILMINHNVDNFSNLSFGKFNENAENYWNCKSYSSVYN